MKHKAGFKDGAWPANLNLRILSEVVPADVLRKLIADNMRKPRAERVIVLPSLRCCKKIFAYKLWSDVLSGKTTWEKEKKDLRKKAGSLISAGIRKDKIIKLYNSREREIVQEKS